MFVMRSKIDVPAISTSVSNHIVTDLYS